MATAIERFDFHGDALDVQRDGDKVYVVLRPMCDAFGVTVQSQLAKLKAKPWACVTEIITHDASGRKQVMAALDLETVPMWLSGIEPRKVKPEVRGKLVRFQLECARALRDHFMPQRAAAAPPDALPGTAPAQARIGDNKRSASLLRGLVRSTASLTGRSNQSIQGELRGPWGVASLYRIPHVALDHTIATIALILQEHAARKRLPPAPRKQVDLPFPVRPTDAPS